MMPSSPFIANVADYLSNSDRLPFVAPSCQVTVQSVQTIRPLELERPKLLLVDYYFSENNISFGHMEVYEDGDCFVINGINSGFRDTPQQTPKTGRGREFVRRAVGYAYQNRYTEVRTSIFAHEASSFWLGLGFRSDAPVKPKWGLASEEATHEVAVWKGKLEQSPDAVWELARTDLGRRVLCNTGRFGVLRFQDEAQRAYAFNRLQLPLDLSKN